MATALPATWLPLAPIRPMAVFFRSDRGTLLKGEKNSSNSENNFPLHHKKPNTETIFKEFFVHKITFESETCWARFSCYDLLLHQVGAGTGTSHPLNNRMIPTGRSATPNEYLKKNPHLPEPQPPAWKMCLQLLEGVHLGGGIRAQTTTHKSVWFSSWRGKSSQPRAVVFRILSLLGIKGGSRDGRDGERGKRWTGISQQYIPGRTIAFVQSRLRELLGKCWIWAQGRLGPVCTREVSRWPKAQVGGPGMLILEKDWGGVLVHSLPTSTRSSDCFSFWSPLQHSWWGDEGKDRFASSLRESQVGCWGLLGFQLPSVGALVLARSQSPGELKQNKTNS